MRKLLLLISITLFCNAAYALQIKGAVDNETVTAKISSLDVTRIVVQGDRIKNFRGISGAYTRENDNNNGEVYIQPSPLFQRTPFTVLVATEKGRHFTLLLTPVAVPGDTLMLIPKGVALRQAAKFENASDYELTISHLIRAMSSGAVPEGYAVRQIDNKKVYQLGNSAELRLKTIYQGLHFQGQIYELTNKKPFPLSLNERTFFKRGTSAISLENIKVGPHCTIRIYRVISYA